MGAWRALSEIAATFRSADIVVLCYHRIRSRERFAAQMSALVERGYVVLSLSQFRDWLNGRHPSPQCPGVLLTFDGCYADQLEHALPVLDSLQFPATFFPASGGLAHNLADVSAQWRNTLLQLTKAGHSIGCHTNSHPNLTLLSVAEIRREVVGSKLILEDALGQRVSAFCYPYGAWNPRVASIVREAGFDLAFTVDLGGVRITDDRYRLKRVPVLGEPGRREFAVYLSGRRLVSGSILLLWKLRERVLDRQWIAIQ